MKKRLGISPVTSFCFPGIFTLQSHHLPRHFSEEACNILLRQAFGRNSTAIVLKQPLLTCVSVIGGKLWEDISLMVMWVQHVGGRNWEEKIGGDTGMQSGLLKTFIISCGILSQPFVSYDRAETFCFPSAARWPALQGTHSRGGNLGLPTLPYLPLPPLPFLAANKREANSLSLLSSQSLWQAGALLPFPFPGQALVGERKALCVCVCCERRLFGKVSFSMAVILVENSQWPQIKDLLVPGAGFTILWKSPTLLPQNVPVLSCLQIHHQQYREALFRSTPDQWAFSLKRLPGSLRGNRRIFCRHISLGEKPVIYYFSECAGVPRPHWQYLTHY